MKTEDRAWRALQQHAAEQLHDGFAERVIRTAHGPGAETWRAFFALGAARIRPGFAERVLRAARAIPGVPSLLDQIAFSAATAAVCVLAVVFLHARNTQREDERNLASWQQIALQVADLDDAR